MNFHLQFPIHPFEEKLKYSHKSLFIGSCFSENIGELFLNYKFNGIINPHGILYNPASISVALLRYIQNQPVTADELFFANDCWNSWEHHSRFSDIDKEQCLEKINNCISTAHEYAKTAEWLFITFGSAFTYTHNQSQQLVGNCHKAPQKEFTKQLLEVDAIVEEYNFLIEQLKAINSKLKIVFTISPVRYIRDGVVENNLSKARLIGSVHELVKQNDHAFYFPAYELVMDDLRDYRFYKSDLVHPNEQATEYVFNKLKHTLMDEKTHVLYEEIKEVITAKNHKPFNSNTESYRKFKAVYALRCNQLQDKFPQLDFKTEAAFFAE